MVIRIAACLLGAVLLLLSSRGGVEAKSYISSIVSGGGLGAYAAHVALPIPNESYVPMGIPTSYLTPTEAQPTGASSHYDFYSDMYGIADGPEYQYYPSERLFRYVEDGSWAAVLPAGVTLLETQINMALEAKERGELEPDVATAFVKSAHFGEAGIWLRPVAQGQMLGASLLAPCSVCSSIEQPADFAMGDFVALLNQRPFDATSAGLGGQEFAIEYFWAYQQGGVGGVIGRYAAPANGHSGRFWPAGYQGEPPYAAPYFATTASFDAAVKDAFEHQRAANATATTPSSPATGPTSLVGLLTALAVGSALFTFRFFGRDTRRHA